MRHLCNIGDHSLSRNVLADCKTDFATCPFEALALQKIPEIDCIILLVRHLNADRRLAGNRRLNAYIRRRKTQLDIVCERDNAPDLDSLRWQELVARHGRAAAKIHDLDVHAEIMQGFLEFQCCCPVLEVTLLPLLLAPFKKVKRRCPVLFRRCLPLRCTALLCHSPLPRCSLRKTLFPPERERTRLLGFCNLNGARQRFLFVLIPLGSLASRNLRELLCLWRFLLFARCAVIRLLRRAARHVSKRAVIALQNFIRAAQRFQQCRVAVRILIWIRQRCCFSFCHCFFRRKCLARKVQHFRCFFRWEFPPCAAAQFPVL